MQTESKVKKTGGQLILRAEGASRAVQGKSWVAMPQGADWCPAKLSILCTGGVDMKPLAHLVSNCQYDLQVLSTPDLATLNLKMLLFLG